jgi:hypothetical protein
VWRGKHWLLPLAAEGDPGAYQRRRALSPTSANAVYGRWYRLSQCVEQNPVVSGGGCGSDASNSSGLRNF